MRVGQKAQDGGTLQYSGLDTGNGADFLFLFFLALVSYPPLYFPDQSPAILQSQEPKLSFQNGFPSFALRTSKEM